MRRIDLTREHPSLNAVRTLAKSEAVLIHSSSGEDFVLESADEFDRETAALGAGEESAVFLDARSRGAEEIPSRKIRQKRGM